jgi:hypothetical protein
VEAALSTGSVVCSLTGALLLVNLVIFAFLAVLAAAFLFFILLTFRVIGIGHYDRVQQSDLVTRSLISKTFHPLSILQACGVCRNG